MSELTFDRIKPLIVDQQINYTNLQVKFRCPVSGKEVSSSAHIEQGATSRVKSSVKRSLLYQVKWGLARAVGSLLGGSSGGYMASSMAMSAMAPGTGTQPSFTDEEIAEATVAAFRSVQAMFAWDDANHRWVSAQAMESVLSEFSKRLRALSGASAWDRDIVGRMLAEVAAADGTISDEEHDFFHAFGGVFSSSLDELARKPPLNAAELSETDAKLREPMLMLAYALAYCDEELDAAEERKLNAFAQGLGIDVGAAAQLAQFAREHIVDQLLGDIYADGRMDAQERANLYSLAQKIGVDRAMVDRLDVRTRKRLGVV